VGALDGVKVIDAGLLVQAPQAAATLREWGADVVKVELPGLGEHSRWLPVQPGDMRSAYYEACNRGKRSVTIDLHSADGVEIFLRLVDWADVLVTNFVPGTMERFGLGADALQARNPRLIFADGSTFGLVGPDAQVEGADLAGQAAGGLISTTGVDGGEVTPIGATVADHIASQNLLAGVLAALYARERTGRGQRVSTSLVGGAIWAQASEITGCMMRDGHVAGRSNRGHALIPGMYGIFRTADGWIAIVGVVGPQRTTFFHVIGRPALADQFPQLLYWDEEKAALFPLVDEAMQAATTDEWCERLAAVGIRHAPVRDHAQVIADRNMWDNGYFATVDGHDVVAVPVAFSATPGAPPARAPELGEHTEEVLLELGYTWDDISRFQEAHAI
jgi:crotonobetainyl-CoA:carnitine CoA-transferase CaiB-like acyl-CoA transferase